MFKIKNIFLLLLCFLMFFVSGCKKNNFVKVSTDIKGQKNAYVFYSNTEGTNLVKKKVDVSEVDNAELLEFLMQKIIEDPKDEGLKSALRTGTKCLWIEREKSLVSVNLSKEIYNDTNMADVLGLGAIVKTLCSVNYVDSVNIFVENNPVTNSKGEKIGIMRESDFVFDADALDSDEENITLFFSDENGEKLISEVRRIKTPKGEVMEKLVMSELIDGPKKENNVQTIPTGTKVISVETKDGVCFVNLSKEFIDKHPGGTTAESITIYSVVNSLTELGNVSKVQFLIDGEKREVFKHLVFNEPFERDVSLVLK